MTLTKEDVKKWLKDLGKDRFWLAEQCGVGKRTVDSWFASDRDLPARVALLISQLMLPTVTTDTQGRNLRRVETLTLQFSKSEWETIKEYQKLHPGKSVAQLAEEFVLNLADSLQKNFSFTPQVIDLFSESLDYTTQVVGNTAAGKPSSGETVPQDIRIYRPLEWGEFVLRVNGKSMEPEIPDESLVIIKKYEDYLFPALGSLVVYNEGNDYTLKKLAKRKNPGTGKMEYVLKSINPAYKDVEPIAEGKISGIYVETLERWEKA